MKRSEEDDGTKETNANHLKNPALSVDKQECYHKVNNLVCKEWTQRVPCT